MANEIHLSPLPPPRGLADKYVADQIAEREQHQHYLASFVAGCLAGALSMFTAVVVAAMFIYV